jgi:hypothetical protein
MVVNNWSRGKIEGNVVLAQNSDYVVNLQESLTKLSATWNNNSYYSRSALAFQLGTRCYSFSQWKMATGYDGDSSWTTGRLTGTRIFVRPNRYESGRAHVVVYNWDRLPTVAVNVGSVLPVGATYEVRNAEDFFAAPVCSGVFDGHPLELPMTGLTVAKPLAELKGPEPTGPTFNVFVLLSKSSQSGVP